jgi:hypothetical protein
MSVADWLKGLDLGQYAQAFADNDIDLALALALALAATLTDGDFKEIGVASIGRRRKLLAAAAALTAKPPAPQTTPLCPRPGRDAERRPITVMFCDSSARRALRRIWIPRTGAIWLGVTSTQPQPLRLHAAAIC